MDSIPLVDRIETTITTTIDQHLHDLDQAAEIAIAILRAAPILRSLNEAREAWVTHEHEDGDEQCITYDPRKGFGTERVLVIPAPVP